MTLTQQHQKKYGFIRDRLACGMFHISCVLDDGTVVVYGSNEGQESEVAQWTDIKKIACGPFRTLGLKNDGTVVCTTGEKWSSGVNAAVGVENFSDAIDISCGSFHNVALRSDGRVQACGSNEHGQCDVESWSNVKKVCAASSHTIALTNDGNLLYCGRNDGGALNLKGMSGVKDIYCGLNDTVIVKEDGSVYAAEFGNECPRKLDISADELVAVSFSVDYYVILKANGTLLVCGDPPFDKSVTEGWTEILDVDCMKKGCQCIFSDGVINSADPYNKIDIKNRAIAVDGDEGGVCSMVDIGGNVMMLGKYIPDDADAKLFDYIPGADGEKLGRATEIADKGDSSHKKGIAWDHLQKYGYLKDRVAGGLGHTAAILHNGEVCACGANRQGQCNIEHWSDIKQIVCTSTATIGLKSNGQVVYAGDFNAFGTIEAGTPLSRWPDNIVSLSACVGNGDHVLGLTSDGKVFAYGSNSNGQCEVNGWFDIIEIKAIFGYSVGVRKDGTVVVCGNDRLKAGVSSWRNIEHVYGENDDFLIGLQYDGKVVCVGKSDYFEPSDFADWENIIYISFSINTVAGITGDGSAYFAGKGSKELIKNGLKDVFFVDVTFGNLTARFADGYAYLGNVSSYSKTESQFVFITVAFLTKFIVSNDGLLFAAIMDEDCHFGQDDCSGKWQLFVNEESIKETNSAPTQEQQKPKPTQQSQPSSSTGCYIATCVYGSYDCPEVWTLRRFRDDTLASTALGRAFIRAYYAISPTLVKWFGESGWFRSFWSKILDKMVSKLNSDGVENTPYDDRDWN